MCLAHTSQLNAPAEHPRPLHGIELILRAHGSEAAGAVGGRGDVLPEANQQHMVTSYENNGNK